MGTVHAEAVNSDLLIARYLPERILGRLSPFPGSQKHRVLSPLSLIYRLC